MKLLLLLAFSFLGSANSLQLLPGTPKVNAIAKYSDNDNVLTFGCPDDLIQEAEKEWEATLENKYPRSRQFYNDVSFSLAS